MSSTQQLLLGEGAGGAIPNYIEQVFSTQVYTGAGTSNTILNYIDLATKGGLVWTKLRASPGGNAPNHRLSDSAIGVDQVLSSNNTDPKTSSASFGISAFNSDGYTITNPGSNGGWNFTNDTFVSWTFRKQPKFFDVFTYTGDGVVGREIPHNLGSVPGCIIVKQTNASREWAVYHTSLGNTKYINLNSAGGAGTLTYWNNTSPTSTVFTVGDWGAVNQAGSTYVAYIFAHDAGGFGLTGTDNVISCGSFVSNGSGVASVNLGYEPQFLLCKTATSTDSWQVWDNMRGMSQTSAAQLYPNTSDAETARTNATPDLRPIPNATGFTHYWSPQAGQTWIYIAIRRGPMKVPTDATTVFSPNYPPAAQLSPYTATTGFPVDLSLSTIAGSGPYNRAAVDRLRGNPELTRSALLFTNLTNAETSSGLNNYQSLASNTALIDNAFWSGYSLRPIYWLFRRAPGFFDEVCYTGNAANRTLEHNLGVAPELMIVKKRSSGSTSNWCVYAAPLANNDAYLFINTTDAVNFTNVLWNSTAPTSTVFSLGASTNINESGQTCVAYLFATCAGVSKVGSYTGNGTTQTINCGFTGGARFVLIRRTDTTGDWYVYDTARGMSVLTDPYSLLNTTDAEVATLGSVTTVATGFALNSAILAAINVSAGNYIFLAIA